MVRRVIGFYTDERGRVRPITRPSGKAFKIKLSRSSLKTAAKEPVVDEHERRVYHIRGRDVEVYVGDEETSQWMNELALSGRAKTVGVGESSKAIVLPNGYGVWLNLDKQGFSQTHLWIPSKELDLEDLDRLVRRLEVEFKREYEVD